MLFRALLFAVAVLNVLAQQSGSLYQALQRALGLSDAQMSRLQQRSPALIAIDRRNPWESARLQESVLDDAQRAKLAVIQRTSARWDAAAATIGLGLISEQQWPGGVYCLIYQVGAYSRFTYATELGLSESQIEQFEKIQRDASEPLWAQIRTKEAQAAELLNSGVSANSPAVLQLRSDASKLAALVNARPQHDLALAVLDDKQREKLAEFEATVEVAREAIELGLIPEPFGSGAEVLCH
jgi:hypothetical protein